MKLKLFLATFLLFSVNARAEESIFDDENPSTTHDDEAIGHDEEVIGHDEEPETVVVPPPVLQSGFLGTYHSQMAFDTAVESETEDIFEWSNGVTLKLDTEISKKWSIVVSGEFAHWTGGKENPDLVNLYINPVDVRTAFDVRLGETYGVLRSGDATIAVGNLITRWGVTDITRPGDVINPLDQTQVTGAQALQRIPQLTLDASYQWKQVNVQAIVVPFFTPDRAFLFGRDTALLSSDTPLTSSFPIGPLFDQLIDSSVQEEVQPLLFSTEEPEEHPGNFSGGMRISATAANTDFAVAYFGGWDRTPTIEIDDELRELLSLAIEDQQVLQDFDLLGFFLRNPSATGLAQSLGDKAGRGESVFASRYERRHTFLLELARYIGPIGVRTDVVFQPEQTYFTEGFRSVRRPTFSAALGLSYESITSEEDAFTVTVEGFTNQPLAADASLTETLVAQSDRGSDEDPLLFFDGGTFGIAGAIVWAIPWIKSTVNLGGRSDLSHRDLIVSGSIARRWQTHLQTSLGFTLFEGFGDELSLGGSFDRNDAVWFRLSGAF